VAKSPGLGLIVGLGNPGAQYAKTRHNAGVWLVDALAERYSASFRAEARFKAQVCRITLGGRPIWLLKPKTYMNESGPSVAGCVSYYKLTSQQTLVVHDELELACGRVNLKRGGGHGGHNGLRDIVSHLNADFVRAQIGIGRPASGHDVASYVLNVPQANDARQITRATSALLDNIETIVAGDIEAATKAIARSLK
jgi:PTH1 family peptidyl-tRNA hydrolase